MPRHPRRPGAVREPIQVYLAPDDRQLLDRLALEHGVSRAEVLRRGIRGLAQGGGARESPMLALLDRLAGEEWPAGLPKRHDQELADDYLGRPVRKRRS